VSMELTGQDGFVVSGLPSLLMLIAISVMPDHRGQKITKNNNLFILQLLVFAIILSINIFSKVKRENKRLE
jgi:hypothetical protein